MRLRLWLLAAIRLLFAPRAPCRLPSPRLRLWLRYSHGVDVDFTDWYYGYLQRRDLQFRLHGTDLSLQTSLGFPQGGVASAKLWILAFNPAIDIINQYSIAGTGYADDCAALFNAPRFDYAVLQLQKMLDELVLWGRSCNLTFNEKKTIAVVFTRSKRNFNNYQLHMNGNYIPYSKSVKYLGVTLDYRLHWKAHVNDKIDKARRLLFKLKSISSQEWGPSHLLMKWAFTGIVRPMISYAAYVWAHEIHSTYIQEKLHTLNRLALSLCSQVPKSTPNQALEIMLDVSPLPLFIYTSGLSTHYRLKDSNPLKWSGYSPKKTYSTSHRRFWQNIIAANHLPPYRTPLDGGSYPNPRKKRRFHIDFRSFSDSSHTCPSQINVFTDGSRLDDHTGAGFVIYLHKEVLAEGSFRLSDHVSVFQAELYAISRAALALAKIP